MFNKKQTNMELEIIEQKRIIPYILMKYINPESGEIKIDLPGLSNAQTIGAGGRYNGLVKQLGGPDTACIGFASGISRVVLALKEQEVKLPIEDGIDVFIMYVNEEEKKYAVYLQQELRMSGFTVDMEYTGRSLKSQFKQAERLNSKFLLILNSEDLDNGEVQIKNIETKQEDKISIEYIMYYLDEQLVDMEDSCGCEDDHDSCQCGHECKCHNHE